MKGVVLEVKKGKRGSSAAISTNQVSYLAEPSYQRNFALI